MITLQPWKQLGGPHSETGLGDSKILHFLIKILFIYFFERGREGERKGEKHQHARDSSITKRIKSTVRKGGRGLTSEQKTSRLPGNGKKMEYSPRINRVGVGWGSVFMCDV